MRSNEDTGCSDGHRKGIERCLRHAGEQCQCRLRGFRLLQGVQVRSLGRSDARMHSRSRCTLEIACAGTEIVEIRCQIALSLTNLPANHMLRNFLVRILPRSSRFLRTRLVRNRILVTGFFAGQICSNSSWILGDPRPSWSKAGSLTSLSRP